MSKEIVAQLASAGLTRVRAHEPMARHTSWRVGGRADYFGVAENPRCLRRTIAVAASNDLPWVVLGGGNNILVADEGIEGLVVLNRLKDLAIEHEGDGDDCLRADAGVFFAQAANYSARRGYSGLEWGIAVPGTVGAGVVNNAGAHQGDVERSLIGADAFDVQGNPVHLTPEGLHYRYRGSALKGTMVETPRLVITRCWFRLERSDAKTALGRITELIRLRGETQPIDQPSAGSTFKNPTGGHAGAYIEEAGLKGFRIGGAEFSRQHANFIVNAGSASARDILALMRLAQTEVERRFHVKLEPEIQLVGRWSKDEIASAGFASNQGANS